VLTSRSRYWYLFEQERLQPQTNHDVAGNSRLKPLLRIYNARDCDPADEFRTGFLQREGYKVIRFWNDDVLLRIDYVLEFIFQAVFCRQSDIEKCPLV
jgi:hypothetical protein